MNWEVHLDWQEQTRLVGRIYLADRGPAATFEYAREWLELPHAFAIDPTALPLHRGLLHSPLLFGALQDCGPDRWGRFLIERAVRKKILGQKPYRDLDYVLALDDATRLGALRFRRDAGGPFLAATQGKLPPLVQLAALLRAAEAISTATDTAADLRFLLGAGSPLGGARPKSAVSLPGGQIGLAKFPKPDDLRDIGAGEILALTLAAQAGIRVAAHRLVTVERQSVAVITRFDRQGRRRIPFLSGASLLGLPHGEPGTYAMLAEAIRQHGDQVTGDLQELWRRLVFSLLASNCDDHLRNHGFLMLRPGRWSLSPAYDLNPVPEIDRTRTSKTPISEDQTEPSIAGALAVAGRFGINATRARTMLHEVYTSVRNWRKSGQRLGLKAAALDPYASAFEHELMDEAGRWLRRRSA